jgi:hypothetical protein
MRAMTTAATAAIATATITAINEVHDRPHTAVLDALELEELGGSGGTIACAAGDCTSPATTSAVKTVRVEIRRFMVTSGFGVPGVVSLFDGRLAHHST